MNVFELWGKLGLDSSAFDKGLTAAGNMAKSFGSKLKTGFVNVTKLGAVALTTTTTAAVAFGKSSVSVGQEFDSAMSQISATLGMSTSDIKNNVNGAADTFNDLRNKAKEMGAATNFSASQAAEGLNILAMSGYSAGESIDMIEDVLHLAAAGSMDMANAASYISGTMKGFNDETKTSAYYADLMAKGATLANTSVQQLGEAMSSGAAGAAAYNQTADSMTVSLLRLAEQGEVGSAAGTALAAAMKDLYTPTDQAKKALQALGVATYDSQGKARDFNDVVNDLDSALSNYTGEQQNAYKQTIFGIQGLNAYNKMTVTSVAKQKEWTTALANSTGEATKQYETMTDNLQGDIDIWNSALDGFKIEISDKLMPTVREFVQFGSDSLSDITTAFKEKGLDGMVTALGDKLAEGITLIVDKIPDVISAGSKLLGALLQGINDNLPQIADGAEEILKELAKGLTDNIPTLLTTISGIVNSLVDTITDEKTLNAVGEAIKNLLKKIPAILQNIARSDLVSKLSETLVYVIGMLADIVSEPDILGDIIDAVFDVINSLIEVIANPENLTKILEALATITEQVAFALIDALPQLVDGIMTLIDNVVAFVTNPENIAKLVELAAELIIALSTGLLAAVPKLLLGVGEIIKTVIENIVNTDWGALGQQLMESIGKALQNASKKLMEWWDGWSQEIGKYAVIAWESVTKFWGDFVDGIKNGIDSFSGWLNGIWQSAVNGVVEFWTPVVNFFVNIVKKVKQAFEIIPKFFCNIFKKAWDGIKNVFSKVGEFFGGIISTITKTFSTVGSTVANAIGSAFKLAINSVIGTIEGALNLIPNAVNGAINLINKLPGVSISAIPTVSLPRLAQGGVLKKGQIGFLEGDGDEAVVPLSKNTEWLDKVADRLSDKTGNSEKIEISLNIENFNNYSKNDIDDLVDLMMSKISAKISRRGAVYA